MTGFIKSKIGDHRHFVFSLAAISALCVVSLGWQPEAAAEYFDNRDEAEARMAGAQEPWDPYYYEPHQAGLMLRLTTGVGLARTSSSGGSQLFDGVALEGSFAIGGVAVPGFAIHATAFGWMISEPYYSFDDGNNEFRGYVDDGTLGLIALGPGVTGWIVPINMYFSGSLGIASMSLREADGATFRLRRGLAMEALVGKEWMVSDLVGLGIAGAFTFHRMPDRLEDVVFSGYSAGIRFSFTWN